MTLETSVATAAQDQRQAAIGEAARHLYDAESALHIARQSGVGTWISAACDRLSEAIADHVRAVAAPQVGTESTSSTSPDAFAHSCWHGLPAR